MPVYLAGPWSKKSLVAKARTYLQERGLRVVSTWTDQEDTTDPALLRHCAESDWRQLMQANVLVLMNLEKSEGKATEMGAALAMGHRVILVGKRTQIFHYLDEVEVVDSLGQAADLLQQQSLEWPTDPWAV